MAKPNNPLQKYNEIPGANMSIDPTQAAPKAPATPSGLSIPQRVANGEQIDANGLPLIPTPEQLRQSPGASKVPEVKPFAQKNPYYQTADNTELKTMQQRVANAQQYQQEVAPIAGEVGQNLPANNDIQLNKFKGNIGSALKEGLAQGLEGASIGAGTGAAAGALGAPITGGLSIPAVAAIGAATGFIGGSIRGVYSNLNQDYEASIRGLDTRYTGALNQMGLIIKDVNSGADPEKAQIVFNEKLAEIDAIDREMKEASKGIWNQKTKKTQEKIIEFNSYQRAKMIRDLQTSILSPNPSKVIDYPTQQEVVAG